MTNFKKIILIIFALGLITVIFLLVKNSITNNGNNQNQIPKITSIPVKISKPNIGNNINEPLNNINWNVDKSVGFKSVDIFTVNKTVINETLIQKLVLLFNCDNQPILNEENFILFGNKEKNINLTIDKKNSILSFGKIISKNDLLSYEKKYNKDQLVELFLNFIKNNFNLPSGIDLNVNKIYYETIGGFSSVTGGDNNLSFYIEANYKTENYDIYSLQGNSIKARYGFDGTLLKLKVVLPFKTINKTDNLTTKNLDEIKNTPLGDFEFFSVNDPKLLNLISESDIVKITSVNVDNINLIYKYNPNDSYLQPYFALGGNGQYKGQSLSVTVLTPALIDAVYR